MNITDVTDAVRELWAFLWPSVLLLITLAGMAYLVANETFRQFGVAIKNAVTPDRVERLERSLNVVGLKPLLPVISGFFLLFLLFATRNIVEGVGSVLPPRVGFEPECVIATVLTDGEIGCLRGQFPSQVNLGGYSRIAMLQGRLNALRTDSGEFWRESAADASALLDAMKFIMLWVVAWSIVEVARFKWSKREVAALAFALLVCAVTVSAAFGNLVYAKNQQLRDEALVLRSLISPKIVCQPLGTRDVTRYATLRNERWWWLEFGPWVKLEWLIRDGVRGAA